MKTLKVKISGVEPLLMHNPSGLGEKKSTKKVSNYDPHEEAEKGLYKNSQGQIYVPAMMVLGAIREAAKSHKAPGQGKASLMKFVLAGVRIAPSEIAISPQEWTVDARPVVVQRSRVMRWRPKFEGWSLEFDLNILDESVVSPENIRTVLEDAGRYKGLGDFRPYFGTFSVDYVRDAETQREVA